MTNVTHAFTESGMGKAPFTFIGIDEGSTGCAHCGTAIRTQCIVRSADGIISKVGTTCVSKTGDKGLIDKVKAEVNRRKREARWAKEEARRQAMFQEQRDRNGGLTDFELAEQRREQEQRDHLKRMAPVVALAAELEDGKGGFRDSVARDLERGILPTPRGEEIVVDILGDKARQAFEQVKAAAQ